MAGESIVLICAKDPMIAALLGLFTELAHATPAFPRPDERPEEALKRVRPLLVVLVDSSLDAARSELFFALAAKRRVGLVIIGDGDRDSRVVALAQPRGIPWLELPADFREFKQALEAGVESQWWRRGPDRRQQQRGPRPSFSGENGTHEGLVYMDDLGRRWFVYDRRAADRRRAQRRAATDPEDQSAKRDVRVFLREDGARRSCELADGEADDVTPASLARQFSRATLG